MLLLTASSAFAQPRGPRQGGNGPGGRRGPPPSALSACQGQSAGASCSFDSPRGTESGACYDVGGGQIACIPADAPRPPRRAEPAPVASALPAVSAGPEAGAVAISNSALVPLEAKPAPVQPPASAPFPWTGLLAGIGGAAGLFALWKQSNQPPTAPVAPTAPKPRGTIIPDLPDSVPTKLLAPAPAEPPPASVTAPIGELAKTFKIVREIGMGGMGVVYEAIDLKLDRRVALKKLRAEIGQSASGRERFLTEAKTVAKLQHQNIVTIHGIIEDQKDVYLVFEYVDGETLDSMIARQKRLTGAEAMTVLQGVADAVDYAHEQKIIHRDLKPANIMIDRAGRAKVMDFGIAHQAKLTISQLTMAAAYGTLAYMPPEQELGKAVRESDVYAFAALTYESLTGSLPFPGPNFHLQKEAMSFTRPSYTFPPLAPSLDPVFERAFQVEPKKRHQTTGDFVRSLQTALASA